MNIDWAGVSGNGNTFLKSRHQIKRQKDSNHHGPRPIDIISILLSLNILSHYLQVKM
jgi:hypothetical protein